MATYSVSLILGWLQVLEVGSIQSHELLGNLIKLADNDDWAPDEELPHELKADGLNIFISILEANSDLVNDGCLIELELHADVLQESISTLSDWGTMINNVLEWPEIDGDDELLLDWGFGKRALDEKVDVVL